MPAFKPNDMYFAYMALSLIPGLSGNDRRVAGALLGHFNKKTGQCDPSIERIATMLGIDQSTVKRATGDLCGKHGLFVKTSHGGKSHRASYEPQWEKYNLIIADWNGRMNGGNPPSNSAELRSLEATDLFSNSAELPPVTAQNCAVEQRNIAPQTYRRNLLKEPNSIVLVETRTGKRSQDGSENRSKRLGNGSLRSSPNSTVTHSQVVRSPAYGDAAREAAKRRWNAKLLAMGGDRYARVIDHITPDLAEAATDAEIRKHGDGLLLLWERLPGEFSHA